jgi:two-component system, sensor histidine kinase ChiS
MPKPESASLQICVIGESDPFLARLLERFAEKGGMRTRLARTGDEVLALVQQHRPALVILEPELPGKLRGWEAARALRDDLETCCIPLLICAWLVKDQALALTGPVSAYLQKPDLHYQDFAAALAAAGLKPALKPGDAD